MPTDVVPFYDLSLLAASNRTITEFSLTSSAGDTLAVQQAEAHSYTIDLTIEKALQPNTKYTLVANLDASLNPNAANTLSLTFTTGAGPVSAPPAPPQASLQHYQLGDGPKSSCSPWVEGTCVAVSAGFPIEETYIYESGQESLSSALHLAPWFNDLTEISPGTGASCVKLRTRAPNATYSSPVVLCGAGAPFATIRGSEAIGCTSQGLTQDGKVVTAFAAAPNGAPAESGDPAPAAAPASSSETSSSCSSTPRSTRAANTGFAALFAFALAARFRRSTRRALVGRRARSAPTQG
ncbi:MAG TPA: hypothetical protein VGC79_05105 [Polyangiaceae bacterium]